MKTFLLNLGITGAYLVSLASAEEVEGVSEVSGSPPFYVYIISGLFLGLIIMWIYTRAKYVLYTKREARKIHGNYRAMKDRLESSKITIAEKERHISKITSELSLLREKKSALEANIRELNDYAEKKRLRNAQLKGQLESYESEFSSLSDSLESCRRSNNSLREERDKAVALYQEQKSENASLRRKLERASQTSLSLEEKLKQVKETGMDLAVADALKVVVDQIRKRKVKRKHLGFIYNNVSKKHHLKPWQFERLKHEAIKAFEESEKEARAAAESGNGETEKEVQP